MALKQAGMDTRLRYTDIRYDGVPRFFCTLGKETRSHTVKRNEVDHDQRSDLQ